MSEVINRLRAWADPNTSRDVRDTDQLATEAADELERLRGDYAKLHGAVETYIQAEPQIRGEAYRDLQGTMDHLAGRDDALGWAACYHRVQQRLARCQALLREACDSIDRAVRRFDNGEMCLAQMPDFINIEWQSRAIVEAASGRAKEEVGE